MQRLYNEVRSPKRHLILPQKRQSKPREKIQTMASTPGSSSRPHGPQEGDWQICSISHLQLSLLLMQGYLPPPDLVSLWAGLSTIGANALAENFPNPSQGERVFFTSFLLRGMGLLIHPFLSELLEYYGIQLHNLTPGSILHISGFVALCELFLGCEAHFELWRKFFCLVPRHQGEGLYSK